MTTFKEFLQAGNVVIKPQIEINIRLRVDTEKHKRKTFYHNNNFFFYYQLTFPSAVLIFPFIGNLKNRKKNKL